MELRYKKIVVAFFVFIFCQSAAQDITYHWEKVNEVHIFYRKAGNPANPALVLFHGTPSSSIMYQDLMRLLKDRFYLIAPDYPAHGYSETPSPNSYAYTFENIATTMTALLNQVGVTKFSMFMQDYGAPIGFRIAVKNPERIESLIIQNGNAYLEGFPLAQDAAGELQTYWKNKNSNFEKEWMEYYKSIKLASADKWRYGSSVNPDRRALDVAVMQKPGTLEIFRDLWFDYGTNVKSYPVWQEYLRKHQPPVLITWGKQDTFFTTPGALAYLKDVPKSEIHLLNADHWAATDTHYHEIAELIKGFWQNLKTR